MTKLYRSAKHTQHWVAYVEGMGWVMFPARDGGWEERRPARGIDPVHLREVALGQAAGTGLLEALQSEALVAA